MDLSAIVILGRFDRPKPICLSAPAAMLPEKVDRFCLKLGSKGLEHCLRGLGEHHAKGLGKRMTGMSPDTQIMEVVDIMHELGYEANAVSEASNQLPIISACNCVYHDLASEH